MMIKTAKKKSAKKTGRFQKPLKRQYVFLGLSHNWRSQFASNRYFACTTNEQIREAACNADKDSIWIASNSKTVDKLLREINKMWTTIPTGQKRLGNILMLSPPRTQVLAMLHVLFEEVIGESDSFVTLPRDELIEVLSMAEDKSGDLFIGGVADTENRALTLVRGNLDRLIVPFHIFRPSGNAKPNFGKFKIVDYGQTVQFGDYEAAADFVLYQVDPDYRKRINAKRREEEKGFGPSLRRLRHLRNLSRDDFNGVAEKTIARIEREEVGKPRGKTLRVIAKTLNLTPDEIESY